MPVKCVENIIFIDFSLEFQLNTLTKMISLGGVTLFDYYLNDIFALENFVADHGNINDNDLNKSKITSSLLTKSTAGTILSASPFINNRN